MIQHIRRILDAEPAPQTLRTHRVCTAAAGAITAAVFLAGTLNQAAQPVFDVASIRPSQIARAGGEGSRREHVALSPTSLTLVNVSLSYCLQWAYNVKFYQVAGPDWIVQQRYDVIAKTEQSAGKEQLRTMLQALLADRFRLRLHRETRIEPVYALVARKGAAKLQQSKSGQDAGTTITNGSFVFQHVTMSDFAERLSDFSAIDRPVLDNTGIEGVYDITLNSAARAVLDDPWSIFTAVEDVGLKLVPRKRPVEVLVIDRAEKPSPN